MDQTNYNLVSELRKNIDDYEQKGVYLVGKPTVRDQFANPENRGRDGGYYYSQKQTLEAIDLACASKYKNGILDAEGKRKTFMNIVNFNAEVALNQIVVTAHDYILEPIDLDYEWPVTFMDKEFKKWSDENSYDDILADLCEDFVSKGSCVVKRVQGQVFRVPLRTMRVTQTAKSLDDAAQGGGYVIIENEMTYRDMKKFKGWKLDNVPKSKPLSVFERYALIPRSILLNFQGKTATKDDDDEMILTVQIIVPEIKTLEGASGQEKGQVVFIEELDSLEGLLEEAHYKKVDGRWLGVGEVEKQLENQIARNLTANLRRRSLLWAARKIFQSTDDEVQRNLLTEVRDGEVLLVKNNGQVEQVGTESRAIGEFQSDENSWAQNSQQISFSFEAATGESMPSGTPFRLGVILSAAVSKYFKRKQTRFSTFLKRSFFDQLIPIFKDEMNAEHSIRYDVGDDNYEQVLEALATIHANAIVKQEWGRGNYISSQDALNKVKTTLIKSPYLYWVIPDDYYDDAHCYMRLNINEDISADIETLTTLWQGYMAKNDPRADRIEKLILAKKGQNLDYLSGPTAGAPAVPAPGAGTKAVPSSVPVNAAQPTA